ncbi:hypothetical protein AVEN_23020-1 [Araneus ventricosus]|uniref:Uncharacterized protein n=1 Tax=Araneus ventricosus TaxID=182803 RepID=A0A4Y2LM63_ARAVE|nr:hypothetical protein AVEN_23020-1 [Araneus ventricosus]
MCNGRSIENYGDATDVSLAGCQISQSHGRENLASQGFIIYLCWIPSHVGILGNEQADKAAKSATISKNGTVPIGDFKTHIKLLLYSKWQEHWNVESENKFHAVKPTVGSWPSLKNRKADTVLTRLRIGHTRFTHRHLLLGDPSPMCSECNCIMSVHHMLSACSNFNSQRLRFFNSTTISLPALLGETPHVHLFAFLKAIGLYSLILNMAYFLLFFLPSRVGEEALHEKLSPLFASCFSCSSSIPPRVGRAWRPIRRVHQGKRRGWEYPEPVAAFPCWAPWWAVPSGPEFFCIHCLDKSRKPLFSGRQCVQEASAENYFDKFFILKRKSSSNEKFHSVSPFLVEKTISGYLGEIPSVRKLRSGDLLVEISSQMQAQIIIKLNNLASIPVTVAPHASLNFSKGVVSCGELLNTSIEETADKLKSQGVTHVRRISMRKAGQLLDTKHLVLTFRGFKIPESIKAGYMKLAVRHYFRNPLRCFKCQRFSHSKASCRGTLTCARCAEASHDSSIVQHPKNVLISKVRILPSLAPVLHGNLRRR